MTVTILLPIILVLSSMHVLGSVLYRRPDSQDPSEAGTVHMVRHRGNGSHRTVLSSEQTSFKYHGVQVQGKGAECPALGPLSVPGHSWDPVDLALALSVELRAVRSAVLSVP